MGTIKEELKGQPQGRDTVASREMAGYKVHVDKPNIADGDVRELKPQGYDPFTWTEADSAMYGVSPDEKIAFIRNPNIWKKHEMSDRGQSWKRTNPGGRILKNPEDGGFVEVADDLIAACVPRAAWEEAMKGREQVAWQELEAIADEAFDPSKRQMEDEAKRNSEQNRRIMRDMGILGRGVSETHGLSYRTACQQFGGPTDEKTMIAEARARNPGKLVEWTPEYRERIEAAKRIAAGLETREDQLQRRMVESQKKLFGTGNNPIGPRNREERQQVFAQANAGKR